MPRPWLASSSCHIASAQARASSSGDSARATHRGLPVNFGGRFAMKASTPSA